MRSNKSPRQKRTRKPKAWGAAFVTNENQLDTIEELEKEERASNERNKECGKRESGGKQKQQQQQQQQQQEETQKEDNDSGETDTLRKAEEEQDTGREPRQEPEPEQEVDGCIRMHVPFRESACQDEGEPEQEKEKHEQEKGSTTQVFIDLENMAKKCKELETAVQEKDVKIQESEEKVIKVEKEKERLLRIIGECEAEKRQLKKDKEAIADKLVMCCQEEEEKEREGRKMKKSLKDMEEQMKQLNKEKEEAIKCEDQLREILIVVKEENAALKQNLDRERQKNLKIVYDKLEEEGRRRTIENYKQTERSGHHKERLEGEMNKELAKDCEKGKSEEKKSKGQENIEQREPEKLVQSKNSEVSQQNKERQTEQNREREKEGETKQKTEFEKKRQQSETKWMIERKECWYHRQGYCKKGNYCNYYHTRSINMYGSRGRLQQKRRESGYYREGHWENRRNWEYNHKRKMCKYFERGYCRNGRYCLDMHRVSEENKTRETYGRRAMQYTHRVSSEKDIYINSQRKACDRSEMQGDQRKICNRREIENREENFRKGQNTAVTRLIERVEDIWKELQRMG